MTDKKSDKRKATWRLIEAARTDIRECFTKQNVLLSSLDQNSKTGPKIMAGDAVKREKIKAFATAFLAFLQSWKDGHTSPDTSKFYADDINRCIDKYMPNGAKVHWSDLCEEETPDQVDEKVEAKDKPKK